jgi:uncharacterized protein
MPLEPVFVDTSGWFAAIVPSDPDHAAAQAWMKTNERPLFTTDFVLDETLTLLRARGQFARAREFGQSMLEGELGTVHFLTEEDFLGAWSVYVRFSDKEWSFTDCTSRALIERLGISSALAFDHHFVQFGSVVVLP